MESSVLRFPLAELGQKNSPFPGSSSAYDLVTPLVRPHIVRSHTSVHDMNVLTPWHILKVGKTRNQNSKYLTSIIMIVGLNPTQGCIRRGLCDKVTLTN